MKILTVHNKISTCYNISRPFKIKSQSCIYLWTVYNKISTFDRSGVLYFGTLHFKIYVSDCNLVVEFHFTDDANIIYTSKSIKDISSKLRCGVKAIFQHLRANQMLLNSGKTEFLPP